MKYAKVVVGLPVEGPFSYLIPQKFNKTIGIGKRVIIPFGKQRVMGYVVGFTSTSPAKKKLKAIEEVLDEKPIIDRDLLKLTHWIADYYFCAWGEAIEAIIPPILRRGKVRVRDVQQKRSLAEDRKQRTEDRRQKTRLTAVQDQALKSIEKSLIQEKREVFLIQNMCNEDRLNIYFKAIEFNLKQGKSSIILMPEISLISPIENQLRLRFGEDVVALIHSRLSKTRLYQEWKKVKDRENSIVVGSRSAIFAPVKNLRLIIIDEEADPSYKQIEVPRYHTKEVALERAKFTRAVVILGSMIPSIESYHSIKTKRYKPIAHMLHKPPEASLAKGGRGPELKVINMRREHYGKQRTKPLISKALESKIKEVLTNKEKIILFLNRRGFATFIHCLNCKTVLRCKDCHTTLKYHFKKRMVICHQCGYKIAAPEICPQCNVSYVRYAGSGTQRLESELHRLFPQARTLRIDTDSVCREVDPVRNYDIGGSKNDISNGVDSRYREVDILAGTQIISKMRFFPRPALIGIISLDTLLNMPDFRGSERAFQLLMHFADLLKESGSLLIQTYFPKAYVLKFVGQRDYFKFYEEELIHRKDLSLPPFKHLSVLTLRGKSEGRLAQQTQELASFLIKKRPRGTDISGPIPASISKLRGKYQQNIIIKTKNVLSLNKFLKENLGGFTRSKIGNIPLTVDVDPL